MATPHESPPPLVADISSVSEPDELPLSELQRNERHASLKQFSEFADKVYESLEELIVNRRLGRYNSVHVLFLAWKTPPTPEIEELAQVFKDKLQFTTERYDITDEEMEESLTMKLEAVVRSHAGVNELLIIYYAGHGRSDMQGSTITWQPTRNSPTSDDIDQRLLNWSMVEDRVNHSIAKDSDILYIVDSSYRPRNYSVDSGGYPTIQGGKKELLATSQAADGYWYTRDLIDELQAHFVQPSSISVSTLHSRMIKRQAERQILELYHLPFSVIARSSSIKLASMTEDDPRPPPTLRDEGHSVTICLIQVDFSDEPEEAPRFWWEKYFDDDSKTVEKEGVKFHPVEYVRCLDYEVERPYYHILALMPRKVSRKIVKKLKWPAFAELETLPSRTPITDEMLDSAVRKLKRRLRG
ncbi:hypothetical protein JMJ35_003536 [Cladonia borealis]|uniref:Peptidase C14 caspase domain-containing protein n=1 Tax=Cladonia borealis TaxID=184061 RepID=A0AA39R542_9LECA|nr:hypothetical protein JMJ35_003536 [Cladonia borealis]